MLAASRLLFVFLLTLAASTRADVTQTASNYGDVPLRDSDLREITVQLLSSYPELASSPGVKFYQAERDASGSITVGIVYLPHAETAGIKEALGFVCSRSESNQAWACNEPHTRTYYSISNQLSELRVTNDVLSSENVFAIAEASHAALALHPDVGPTDQCDAQAISRRGVGPGMPDGFLVSMSCKGGDGNKSITMLATETSNADTTQPGHWHVSEYVFPQPR